MENKNELIINEIGILGIEKDKALNIHINLENEEVIFNLISNDHMKDYFLIWGSCNRYPFDSIADKNIRVFHARIKRYFKSVLSFLDALIILGKNKKEDQKDKYYNNFWNIKHTRLFLKEFNFKKYSELNEQDFKNIVSFIYENYEEIKKIEHLL